MKSIVKRLEEKSASLGNYNRKYLHIVSTNIESLTAALEQRGMLDRVHLWTHSTELADEMDTIMEAAAGEEEMLDFLGCFYALQFLHMNLRTIDIAKLELATSPRRTHAVRRLMLEAGRMFRHLTKNYMEHLLRVFLEGRETPEYVMLGVGTRSDQDDIDLGIVHRGPEDPRHLNRALALLASRMFKTATQLHFHLSEYVGGNRLTATVEEYEEILDSGGYDFVIVTEMLGAAAILGSAGLHDEFQRRVTDRFYHHPRRKSNRFHEGYLRTMLAEIQSLLTRPHPSEAINPKEDCLRPIKGLLSALKLVHGVRRVNAWELIDELKERNPGRRGSYEDLEAALSFFELFRYLYQMMISQEEDIRLHDEQIGGMVARIAEMIGFERKGVVSAKDFLLVRYYEHLDRSIEAIETLSGDLKKHLLSTSIYRPIFSGRIHGRPKFEGNLAVDFMRASAMLGGIAYWDDFLDRLTDDGRFYQEFIGSLADLDEDRLAAVARSYVSAARHDISPILRFIVVVGRKARDDRGRAIFNLMSAMFIEELSAAPGSSEALAHLSYAHADALNSYFALIDHDQLGTLRRSVTAMRTLPEHAGLHEQLLALIDVHFQSSRFFKRHFHPILDKYPVFIRHLQSNDKLGEIADGLLGDLTSLPTLEQRFERLGDYYDMEFVRVSLLVLGGADSERSDAEFIEFYDDYIQTLYELCLEEVHATLGHARHLRDRFALYAAGGLAREQGFDDDYDMIVILDSSDPEEIAYCNKVIARMNSHILKRGILPHHRFACHFGSYAVNLEQLADHLNGRRLDVFIDQSQILSSRMLVGSGKLEDKLLRRIIVPFVFDRAGDYVAHMVGEMRSRHGAADQLRNNIKECSGGLRDIEMLLLVYKALHRVRDPLTRKFLRSLRRLDPRKTAAFARIEEHFDFLKNLRDLYRLKVAACDDIEERHLPVVASSMGYGEGDEAGGQLHRDFHERCGQVAGIVEELLAGMS